MAAHFWRLIDLPLVEIVLAGVLATKPDDQRKDDLLLRAEDRPLRFTQPGSKTERLAASIFRPDYPQEQTSSMRSGTSDLCQTRT